METLAMLFVCLCLTSFILGTAGAPPVTECPQGSFKNGNSCYMIGHLLSNWPDSLVYCEAYRAHLARIDSPQEQLFVTNLLQTHQGAATDQNQYFWIGGTDAVTEGVWMWAKTLDVIEYTNWNPGEPNNDPNHADHHQDCMAIYGKTGLWDDGYCETQHNFICEIELGMDNSELVG